MNDLVEQILELIKGKKTAIDMQAIMFQSRSTTYRLSLYTHLTLPTTPYV